MLKLYDDELCGDSYKARLLLGLLGVEYQRERVESFPCAENRMPSFLALSPLGHLPVLQTEEVVLNDAHAILVYLARRFGAAAGTGTHWLPAGALELAQVQNGLGMAARLSAAVFPLRGAVLRRQAAPMRLLRTEAKRLLRTEAKRLLRVLDETLWFNEAAGAPFVCATRLPSIADIACFAPVALLDEAEIESIDFPALRRWSLRIRRLAGFTTMAGVYAAV